MDSINNIVRRLRESRILNEYKDYSKYSREELISLAQDGDQLAITTLMDTHKDFLGKMSHKYILNSGDEDDIEQLAMIAFWDAIQSYNPDTSGDFEAYAGMIIKRKLTDELRKDSAEKRQLNNLATSLEDTLASDDEGGESSVGDTIASSDLSPEEQFLGKEGAKELMRFMRDKFSERERDVVMRHIKGDKIPQIAEETGMSYKSVENTLMRIKNKLNDYLRKPANESKTFRREQDIKFSDEEKQILESVITKVNAQESIRESKIASLRTSYDNYTEEQLDKELGSIEEEIEDIADDMKDTHYDDRDDLLSKLDDLRSKLYAMEEYLTDEQYNKSEDLIDEIAKAEDIEYDGPVHEKDPYAERGLRKSDFF